MGILNLLGWIVVMIIIVLIGLRLYANILLNKKMMDMTLRYYSKSTCRYCQEFDSTFTLLKWIVPTNVKFVKYVCDKGESVDCVKAKIESYPTIILEEKGIDKKFGTNNTKTFNGERSLTNLLNFIYY